MSFNSNLIAVRYVSALFDLAEENKQHDNIKKDCLVIKEIVSKSAELQKFLVNPVITRMQAEKAIGALLDAIKASPLTRQFFSLLAKQRRLALTAVIIDKYLARLAESRNELPVQVISATTLDKKQIELLSSVLSKATGKKIELQLSENAELIGGLQIRIGSKMLDSSVSGKLARLRQSLKKAA